MNHSLPKEVYIGCMISLILVMLVGFLSLYTTEKQKNQEYRLEQAYQILNQVETMQYFLIDMETGRRGFRATNARIFLQPYYNSLPKISPTIESLKASVKSNPFLRAELLKLESEVNDILHFWDSLGTDAENYSRETVHKLTSIENLKMGLILTRINGIKSIQKDLLNELKLGNQQLRQRTTIAITAGTLLILLIVSILVYIVIREFKNKVRAFYSEQRINKQKSAFISLASHEFRTPLSNIQLSTSIIQKYIEQSKIEQPITKSIVKHTSKIKHSVEHLTSILTDFLSLDRLESGNIIPVLDSFNLEIACREIIEEMEYISKPNQTILYEHSGTTNTVSLDKNLIKNSLRNLISNAIKYSGDDTIIRINTLINPDECIISVSDNGIGIPESDQEHLFQPFFRAGNTSNIPGTGLGLNIVLRYVKLLDGELSFESKLKQGSIFTLTFPNYQNRKLTEIAGKEELNIV